MKPQLGEGCRHLRDPGKLDDHIEIVVLAGLKSEQGINSPTTVHPAGHVGPSKRIEDLEHLAGGHLPPSVA